VINALLTTKQLVIDGADLVYLALKRFSFKEENDNA
jgi:predicted nucleic-acid-binding protein